MEEIYQNLVCSVDGDFAPESVPFDALIRKWIAALIDEELEHA